MTSVPFPGGALDLSTLKPAPPAPAGASWVLDVDEASFEQALQLSMQHPLVLEFWSPRSTSQVSDVLKALANEAQGAYLLVRMNIDEAPTIAQALQVQAVPMVVGVLMGQLAPLFQGTADRATAKAALDQLVQVAHANGLSGRAQPVAAPDAAEQAGPDPRFAAADAALQSGDFATAVAEFDKLLAANPADAEASAGRAQASLILRLESANPPETAARVQADPDDVDAQLAMADIELANGQVKASFDRLVDVVRRTAGDERERVRLRLLELFETVGQTAPEVLSARRALMSALF